jgi:hypothetical protein
MSTIKIINPDNVTAFSIKCDNSSGTQSAVYRIFDQSGIVAAVKGGTVVAPSFATAGVNATKATTIANPIVLSGFNYEVQSSASQFNQPFNIVRCSIDGRSNQHPNVIAKARRNTQFQEKLLTIQERFVVDDQTAIEVTVNASETVEFTFFVEGFLVK